MPIINQLIAFQKFEVIRNRIAEILADELANQYTFHNDAALNPTVWLERIVPFSVSEMPAINVVFVREDFDNADILQADGSCIFNIDVFTTAKSDDDNDGDKISAIKNQRILGMCRAILQDPKYIRLGYEPPFNATRNVRAIMTSDPANNPDATSAVQTRLEYSIKIIETTDIPQPVPIAGNGTKVTLGLTNKGYRYEMPPSNYAFTYTLPFNLS